MSNSAFSALVSVSGTANQVTATAGLYPVLAIANNPVLPSNGSVTVPAGTTAQRVLGLGALRLNTDTGFFEVSTDNATWVDLAVGGGGIASVTGTALQIDVTAGVNPVISIDPGYIGQTSITTLGTIGTGTWAGTTIALNHGGTNAALTASNGGIVWSNATQMQILAGTATGNQMLQSGATATPAWSTATWPATTTINQLLYSSAANTVVGLATGNDGVLITSAGGVPSISSTLPAVVQGNITATGALANGSLAAGFTPVTVPLGGTGITTTTPYSVICAGTTATGTFQSLAALGATGTVLTSNGVSALPSFQTVGGGGGGAASFWIRFPGGSSTITSQFNVTTLTNNGTGDNTITYTTALANANYLAVGSAQGSGAGYPLISIYTISGGTTQAPTTTTSRYFTIIAGVSAVDNLTCIVGFGT